MQNWSLPIPPDEAMRVVSSLIRKRLGKCTPDQVGDVMLAVLKNLWRYDPNRGAPTTFLAAVTFSVLASRRAVRLIKEEAEWVELQDERCGTSFPSEDIVMVAPPEFQSVVDRLVEFAEVAAEEQHANPRQYIEDAVALAERVVAWYNWCL